MMFEDKLEKVKKEIRSVIITFPNGVSLTGFLRAFKQLLGINLPTRNFGYTSDIDFLYSLPDVIHIGRNRSGEYELKAVADETTEHIRKLISKQKVNNSKPKNTYFSSKYIDTIGNNSFKINTFVSATLRENLFKILIEHPDGISYIPLLTAYQKMFKKPLNLDWLSENHDDRLKKLASAVSELEVRDVHNTERLFYFPNKQEKNSYFKNSNGLKNLLSKDIRATTFEENSDNSVQDKTYVSAVPQIVKNNFEKIMKKYPTGVLARHFPALYEKLTGEIFNLYDLGYNSFVELVDALPEIFFYEIRESPNEWILFHPSFKKDGTHVKDIKAISGFSSKKLEDINSICKLDMFCGTALPTIPYIEPQLPSDITQTEYVPIFISAIISPSQFWFKFRNEGVVSRFRDFEEKIQSFYQSNLSTTQKMSKNDIIVGASCAALHEGHWYRVIVISSLHFEHVNVYFVDYGGWEKVPCSSLRYLKYEFITLPAQAFKAELAFVKPFERMEEWTIRAEKRFLELCSNCCLMARVYSKSDNILSVLLCDTSGEDDIYVNDVLINEGLAEYVADSSSVENSTDSISDVNGTCSNRSDSDLLIPKPVINQTRHQNKLSKFVKRVSLGDGYRIHIVIVTKKAYVSAEDLCNLFWPNKSSEMLSSRLQCKNIEIPSIIICKEDYKELFQQCENISVKGFQHASLHQYSVELYPLFFAMKVLNALGHPSVNVRETIKKEIHNFQSFNEDWETSNVDNMDDIPHKNMEDIYNLCMYDLKVLQEGIKYKRIKLQSDFEKSSSDCLIKNLEKVEEFSNIITNRIACIESICLSYSNEEVQDS